MTEKLGHAEAICLVRRMKHDIQPNDGFQQQLQLWKVSYIVLTSLMYPRNFVGSNRMPVFIGSVSGLLAKRQLGRASLARERQRQRKKFQFVKHAASCWRSKY